MNGLKKSPGVIFLLAGALALIAPQANSGLTELRWVSHYAFPGEALVGAVLVGLAYLLLGRVPRQTSGPNL
jgi:hypothetical protein